MIRLALTCLLATLLLAACQTAPVAPVEPPRPATPPPAPPPPLPKVALVLGGGGARGFAHIGVLKLLDVEGLHPDLIVGTSAGSVAGALYAAGINGFDLQQMSYDMERAQITDWSVIGKGLIRGDALEAYVNRVVQNRSIEKLPIRFACVATRVDNGQAALFQSGNLGQAVRASSSVPGIFEPTVIKGVEYVDGGLVAPVPIRFARQLGADIVIAVDVSTPPDSSATTGKFDVLMRTFDIMGQTIRATELSQADVLIRPDLAHIASTDFDSRQLAILQGERAALAALPQIRARVAARINQPLTAEPGSTSQLGLLP